MIAQVIKIVSNQYTLETQDKKNIEAFALGKLRLDKSPKVGDYVEYEEYEQKYGITKILPRKTDLIRPQIANVDQALIVMSALEPEFSISLVDRICALIHFANITPIICVTKLDLVDKNHSIYAIIKEYQEAGYTVLCNGNNALDVRFDTIFKDKITVLTGQSGVGKSSLLNSLNPEFKLQIQDISKALGRGKHTTRHVELFKIHGGYVADTPGFSSLDFSYMEEEDLVQSILEFKPYVGKCKFNDCKHEHEPGCAIKQAILDNKISKHRYQSYLEIKKIINDRRKKI